ncbi:hypothetical protein PCLA_04f0362 [Pseudomonas citronellolis]|nr:hypothetical protein PCLA_04f0362 [Pseudomonas citronellolis]
MCRAPGARFRAAHLNCRWMSGPGATPAPLTPRRTDGQMRAVPGASRRRA